MESARSIFSSPRLSRMIFWLGALVLAAGVTLFVIKIADRGSSASTASHPLPKTVPIPPEEQAQTNVKLSEVPKAVFTVAREFIHTAVERKHLAKSWAIILPGSSLREGFTRKQWLTGSISVVPFSDPIINEDQWDVEWFAKREVQLTVTLSPGKHSQEPRTLAFHIGLTKVGNGQKGHWLVDYWGPVDTTVVPHIGD
jgi:hypothetical protein